MNPMIWRRLLVLDCTSIADLHAIIQIAMGWKNSYLHRFDIWGKEYGISYEGGISFQDDPLNIFLKDFSFRINEKFVYEYNSFDHWEHEIRLEKKVPASNKKIYPCYYAAPPEDCGGPWSFMKLKDYYSVWRIEEKILEAFERYKADKDLVEFRKTLEELRYWLTYHQFDRRKVNHQLQRYFNNQNQLSIEEIQDED
ncbi:plasmid pRiA4b ORF-3 family protein [Candidatus Odyssella acanthamoebae]|uniref:plasmid pRiA4b ORF-3 family protein n=1 Tax=Candidatus Odyssella acanthamoebae TaxID=91604 RepID=UPI002A4E2E50|nr:plasmid pRiA4b ORF-3 family protein [Candidatus Paracaedibacter acanthamoebae]